MSGLAMDGGIELFSKTLLVQNFSIKHGNTELGHFYSARYRLGLDVLEQALDGYS